MANRSIYKYKIDITDKQILTLPKGAKILSVINQFNVACIYAMVDTETTETEKYSLQCYGTGHPIRHDDSYKFLGTVAMLDGNFIYHLFFLPLIHSFKLS